jgi:hypothetical protein
VDTARSSNKKQSLKISPQPAAFSNQNRLLVGLFPLQEAVIKKTLVPSTLPKPNPTSKPKVVAEKQRDGNWTFKKVLVSIEPDTDSPWALNNKAISSTTSSVDLVEDL